MIASFCQLFFERVVFNIDYFSYFVQREKMSVTLMCFWELVVLTFGG